MVPLNCAGCGKYIIKSINTGTSAKRRLMTLGIFPGDEIEVIKPSPGPVIIEKGGTRIGIGYGMASRIMVEKISEVK